MREKLEKTRKIFATINIVKAFIWIILVIVAVSTLRAIFSPLLPTSEEYIGGFPENFWENFERWKSIHLLRRVALFHEYYNIDTILNILGYLFLLLLVTSVWNALKKGEFLKKSEGVIESYLIWAVSGLLITIVFITKFVTADNIAQVGLGILGFTLSIVALLFARDRIKKKGLG